MKKIIIIISFFTVLLSSCDLERTIYIDNIPVTPYPVLNALIYANSDTSYFYITESRPIYNDTISIFSNSNRLRYNIIKDANLNLDIDGKILPIEYSLVDSAYVFIGKLKEGDKVSIQSVHKGKEMQSMAILPSPPQVVSVDTMSFDGIQNGVVTNFTMFKLKIKDTPGKNDYYRLLVNNEFYAVSGDTIRLNPFFSTYYSNDPVLTDGNMGSPGNSAVGLASSVYNYFSIFRDVRFAGKEYTLTFYVENSPSYYYYNGLEETEYTLKRHLNVRLQSISEDLYKYYSSLQRSRQAAYDNVSEPVMVHTNINGGLGIFGACNEIEVFEYKDF